MSLLGKLSRSLFHAASIANTANIISSGDPARIAKHFVRKRAYKKLSTIGASHRTGRVGTRR